MKCRHCKNELQIELIDLGSQPPSNSYLKLEDLEKAETYLPLKVYVCSKCFLVQTADYTQRETFFNEEYAYFSSTSKTWLKHASDYVEHIIQKLNINSSSFVMEVASNDGYLLKNFQDKKIPCLGIEPTKSTAEKSINLGIDTLVEFFGFETARNVRAKYGGADLIICNNVYAHVPDINDFTKALEFALSNDGVVTLEFPHLLNLIKFCQFDTIYHEHFSYLSVSTVQQIFSEYNLRIFDVEELSTHGGSVRIYGCKETASYATANTVGNIIHREEQSGLFDEITFQNFSSKAFEISENFVEFLLTAKGKGQKVCGYGAAAKGNTLINLSGVKPNLLPYVADAAPSKIGKFLPGSRIPIIDPKRIAEIEPDYIVIFPWNIADEIIQQLSNLTGSAYKFVTFVPDYREL